MSPEGETRQSQAKAATAVVVAAAREAVARVMPVLDEENWARTDIAMSIGKEIEKEREILMVFFLFQNELLLLLILHNPV